MTLVRAVEPPAQHSAQPLIGATLAGKPSWRVSDWRLLLALSLALTAAPLLWPTFAPLIDLPNHMSRYRIALDYAASPYFHRWFDFHWALVGNLGVDLLVAAFAPALGLEPATKLVVLAIPLITVAGMALIARETHGRLPATALFAFPFAYNFPFNFGFVNFALSVALCLLFFGLWLRLGRTGRLRLRSWLLVPAGCLTWLAHAYGWGLLGIMIFVAELFDRGKASRDWAHAFARAIIACLPLALPLLAMLHWKVGDPTGGTTLFSSSAARKFGYLFLALKNYDAWADQGAIALVWAVLTVAVARRDIRFDPRLTAVALATVAVFFVMPYQLMGSGYADMRLAPYAIALLLLAFAPIERTRFTRLLSVVAACFFAGRMMYQTLTYAHIANVHERQLVALDHLPVGSRVFGFARTDCIETWAGDRLDHINRLAIVRRQALTNDTWPVSVSQTLSVRPQAVDEQSDFDSQRFAPPDCRFAKRQDVPGMLAELPRNRYDYLWLIGVPSKLWPQRPWLREVWRSDSAILYKIAPPAAG